MPNSSQNHQDTIVALATAFGTGAIAIIRLSGADAITIVSKVFFSRNSKKKIENADSHTIHLGFLRSGETILDEVLVSVFRAPNSYTGENIVEISCHGSIFIQQSIVQLMIENGARMAEAGEFTMRAFFNGKMDLSQTEAVADLIHSQSAAARDVAIKQLRGGFSKDLSHLREKLIEFASLIELELDFGEDDVEFANRQQLMELVNEIIEKLTQLSNSFKLGNAIKTGISVVIVGRPNAGKSTLLNMILNDERAIVTNIPGTTRDTLEETVNIRGVQFRFVDTAGLRETTDEVEKIGVERALEQVKKASVYIYLFDSNELSINEIQRDLSELPEESPRLIVGNKVDLISEEKLSELKNVSAKEISAKNQLVFISAKSKSGKQDLEDSLFSVLDLENLSENETIVTNVRHFQALENAKAMLLEVKDGLEMEISGDLLAIDIRAALRELGSITGEVSVDKDILGTIFGKFCIGK